ncbi:hypothetical protein CQW23_26790 [Capsicum baccatum]|uniref:Gnk2-homologous domain-containing protein n=1 Tax=Capsicum baccatum TaxID=33114 RepID=A0A2G2VPT4_CAPBA|nr:hypothetical protein CQW23_26790 [Capsicum baccatum]
MERPAILRSLFVIVLVVLLPDTSVAEPRAHIVQFTCGNESTRITIPNYVGTLEILSEQMRTRGYRIGVTGTEPNATYGLGQCYGDLSLLDCVLCYIAARDVFANCYPINGA